MTNAPHLLPGCARRFPLRGRPLSDAIVSDGLTCAFEQRAMSEATEDYAARLGLGRERQDACALGSHERAAAATASGRLSEEIIPVAVPQRRGGPVTVQSDEGIMAATTPEALARLRPAFSPGGTITASNASQLSDGAAAVVLCSGETAQELGVTPLAEIVSYGEVAGPDPSLGTQPSRALRVAAARVGIAVADLDVVEISEAFAAVVLASLDDLGLEEGRCNPNGGAVALGHPIGMSGARLALTLAYELRRCGGGTGGAALCGGGGQGDAIVLRTVS